MNLTLANWTYLLGGLTTLYGLIGLAAPGLSRKALAAFPRSAPAAWVLTAIDLACVSYIVFNASLGRFDSWKPALYVVAPFCFFLLIQYLDDLLAPRALGGLLLLAPNPILAAARWHPSDWRLVMVVLAYVAIVKGMLLILSPYRFRRWTAWWIENDARCRMGALIKLIAGVALLALATFVYRR